MVLGHESSGVVTSVGSKVRGLKAGDRVALEPGVCCRRCERCKEGLYNLCFDMRFAATPPYDGTLAKYYTLPEDFCYKLPEEVPLEHGALVEPLAVGVHIARTQANVKPGQSVVVFGAGPIGLLSCAVAKALGANKICIVDINESRLKFAKDYAATHTVLSLRVPAEEMAGTLKENCDVPLGFDVAIDASGAEPCIQTAIHALRSGGTFVQGGMGKPDITFPIGAACAKELHIKGSFRYGPGDYKLAVEFLATGKVKVNELITARYKFGDAEKAFEETKAAKGIKVIIEGPE
ncbi:GroES-like protein [Myriangium duriaei CBS 260.36]|uniref:D-xylulose reductase n=1 Tax=Myriangium duriaei CBS 260.36 TaxID=1168546 RepID=A0A9P4J2Z2_9PEZI|nr:GroES-like protein [Myriangium duriaei CBS 260.36]